MSKNSKKVKMDFIDTAPEMKDLIDSMINADEVSQVYYFAEVFTQLLKYPEFREFVFQKFVIINSIDPETSLVKVSVKRESETDAEIRKAAERFAEVFNTTRVKS